MKFLERDFFTQDPVRCARELIGCELVWNDCAGVIVETEAYRALGDEACHTFVRPSTRAFVVGHPPGTAYVYLNYGVYWLLNVLVKGPQGDGFVLFRALEPTRGLPEMERRRGLKAKSPSLVQLCSGPGKLTLALGIDGREHGRDLCSGKAVGFLGPVGSGEVVADLRIGITKAAHWPWRFLLSGSPFVSVRAGGGKSKSQTAREGRSGL